MQSDESIVMSGEVLDDNVVSKDSVLAHFRAMWQDLHVYAAKFALKPTAQDIEEAEVWMLAWFDRMPVNCECRGEWQRIMKAMPPPYANGALDFFWWTVAAHDFVNLRLDKPLWANASKVHPLVLAMLKNGEYKGMENKLKRPAMNRF